MSQVQADRPDDSGPPPPYVNPWVVHSDSEQLMGSQNPSYGTVERGEIDARIQRPKKALVLLKVIFYTTSLILFAMAAYSVYESLNVERHDRLRRQWAEEENRWATMRKAWAAELRKRETERAAMEEERRKERAAMEEERRKERAAIEEERRKWDRERREKEQQKRQEQEEEARKRATIAWVGLQPGHCLRYKLKEYSATLSHVPLGVDGIEECWKKSIEIHGRQWFPSQCEDQGLCGRVTGHWQVDFDEPSCTPWWGYPTDKGCVESGIRRYENRLENLQDLTDWPIICRTAPTSIGGTWYDGPTSCEHWGNDIWGIWLINDDTCR